MDYNFIIKDMILDYMRIDAYKEIMTNFRKLDITDVNNGFQKRYNGFYKVRRNSKWQEKYYDFFEKNKNRTDISFVEILNAISDKNCEYSFASKMLATINPDKPVLDKHVLNYFGYTVVGKTKKDKIESAIKIYDSLKKEYEKLLGDKEIVNTVSQLKKLVDKYELTDIKILDYIFWCKGKTSTKNGK